MRAELEFAKIKYLRILNFSNLQNLALEVDSASQQTAAARAAARGAAIAAAGANAAAAAERALPYGYSAEPVGVPNYGGLGAACRSRPPFLAGCPPATPGSRFFICPQPSLKISSTFTSGLFLQYSKFAETPVPCERFGVNVYQRHLRLVFGCIKALFYF